MSAVAKVARRGFLLASAAVTGGVAFGVWAVRNPHANPLAAQAEDGEAVFNPWVTVTAQGITLDRSARGQGPGRVFDTSALIAEKMDLAGAILTCPLACLRRRTGTGRWAAAQRRS